MNARLLVIDDDAVTRELLTEVLHDEGYVVEACESGRAALTRAIEESFDLAITDVRMPEMDGIAVTQALKARQLGRDGGRSHPARRVRLRQQADESR